MPHSSGSPTLPSHLQAEFSSLLRELSACGHQAVTFLERVRLPGWCRRPLFYFLGYIARSDGRVTEADITYAEGLIRALNLSGRQRQRAIQWFQSGKKAEELPPLKGLSLRLTRRLWPAPSLTVAICLCHAAQIQGPPGKPRRYRCEDAIDQMGLPVSVSDHILESYASKVWVRAADTPSRPETYDQACQLLGVTRRESLAQIKRAYRRKVSECHPDKLSQQTLSPRELAIAKEQLLRYQQAWELIKQRNQTI
ncbi:DnaJ domain-containing protein [Marinobacter pelagius]|uniref:DnaJ domain-containing protein n=1 Tax=Marinobacter sp. C7 TaxID=2951363 RepID=UPI001EEFEF3E|nr:DnaJ domain-containing protein [Marinobacter sp. C7]MCG7198261.1 DnaJ domain-containing protein [Marinobacter sp. C7]